MSYEECKVIAIERTQGYNISLDTAYELKDAFVFEDSKTQCEGILPIVVDQNGETYNLWSYLNKHDLSMDDMIDREF